MSFTVTILGSASAKPTPGRHPSAQVVNVHEQHYLVDAGRGYAAAVGPLRNRSAAAAGRLSLAPARRPLLRALSRCSRRSGFTAAALRSGLCTGPVRRDSRLPPALFRQRTALRRGVARGRYDLSSAAPRKPFARSMEHPAAPPRPHVRLPLPRKGAAAERRQIQNHEIRPLDRADHRRQTGRSRAARFGRDAAQRGADPTAPQARGRTPTCRTRPSRPRRRGWPQASTCSTTRRPTPPPSGRSPASGDTPRRPKPHGQPSAPGPDGS